MRALHAGQIGDKATMETAQVRENIRKLRFMPDLPVDLREKLIDILLRISAPRSLPTATVFIREGEHIDERGYILLEGAVLVEKTEHPDMTCEAPELIGEMQQFNPSHTRTASVTTSMPSTVLRFQWDEFWNAVRQELTPQEVDTVRETLEIHAWEHFI